MAQLQRLGTLATTIRQEEGDTIVTYHSTEVVRFNSREVILNTGGYFTNTTKTRMNQASNQFSLCYTVYQQDYSWYVSYNGKACQFGGDTLRLTR